MSSTVELLEELNVQRTSLAANLVTKGVEAFSTEGFTTLVPKVLDISGGSSESSGSSLPASSGKTYSLGDAFKALADGKTHVQTYSTAEPLTADGVVFDTNLEAINGILIYDLDSSITANSTPECSYINLCFFENEEILYSLQAINAMSSSNATYGIIPVRGTNDGKSSCGIARGMLSVSGGSFTVKPDFAKNASYTPFYPGHTYVIVVW